MAMLDGTGLDIVVNDLVVAESPDGLSPIPIGDSSTLSFTLNYELSNGDEYKIHGTSDWSNPGGSEAGGNLAYSIEYVGNHEETSTGNDYISVEGNRVWSTTSGPYIGGFALTVTFGGGIAEGSSVDALYVAPGSSLHLPPFAAPGVKLYEQGSLSLTPSNGAFSMDVIRTAFFESGSPIGSYITYNGAPAPCFVQGTLLSSQRGEVGVEELVVGDLVQTKFSGFVPVRWIGRRSYAGLFIAGNHLMLPVTIRAGALADGVPHTDLHVSPGHAMWVDGQLVPAWRLINGVTIIQAAAVDQVTYFHVELHEHGLLLANGAPAESFLDEAGFRGQFHNAAEFKALYPDTLPQSRMQPRLEDGFALQHLQRRLADRAGIQRAVVPVGALRGFVDQAGPERVCGWAQDIDSPEEAVALEISADGLPVLCVLANAYRTDLRQAGLGSGCHSFDVTLPKEFPGRIAVCRTIDGCMLAHTSNATDRIARQAA